MTKTLPHLYHWLHSEHFLVPQPSETLHYPFPQPSHHSQKLIYLKSQAALQMGKCCMILNTALFLHMYKFFTVNLSFLCLSVWEDKFRHLHLENSSLLPRQLNLRCNRLFPKGILKSRVSVCQESAISHFTD